MIPQRVAPLGTTMTIREQLQRGLGSAYMIDRELGGGGMSRVFLAEYTVLGRKVVLKVLPPELAGVVNEERFNRETLLVANLQHPHIVPVLAVGSMDGLPWFSMPSVEGESLRTRLDRGASLSMNEVVFVLRDVAKALSYAHQRGIVHRDIKPDNILLTGDSACARRRVCEHQRVYRRVLGGVADARSVSHHDLTRYNFTLPCRAKSNSTLTLYIYKNYRTCTSKPPKHVREPLQVYLDQDDRDLLLEAARISALPQTEILRRGLRRVAADILAEHRPGASLDQLIGSLGTADDIPTDLAARHDEYLYRIGEADGPSGD